MDIYEAYEERLYKKAPYIGFVSLILTIIAGLLLFSGFWQWWIIVQLLGLAFAFISLAFREERESVYLWYITAYLFFGCAFIITLILQIAWMFVK